MSKPLKVIGMVAGGIALIATGVGAAGGLGILAASTATQVGAIAGVVSGIATMGSQALAKPPPVRGSVSQILIDPDAVQPYVMGEGYFAGVMRHDTAYGPTLNKVPNPYRFMPVVYSGGGPVQSITPQVDYKAIGSWYSGFLYTDTQLGACPEADALSPQWAGATGWGSDYKLSGQAAIGWSFKFDKEGEVFASGLPLQGAIGQWVKAYDPRKDSTQPGGSGAHRLGNESTYEYTANPALHAGMYAYGRYQNGKRTIGMGLPADGIEWTVVSAWANVCEANGWTMFGVVYEPGDRWANLKDICFAGGAEPVAGGKLSFKYAAPVIALDTITDDDLTDNVASVMAMQSFRDRINTAVPKYRSAAHNWEIVDAEPVVNATFLAEDGEEKRETWPFNFVTGVNQAAVLAAYRVWETRELAPITLPCKPRMRYYRPGECLHIDLPELGLDTDAIILRREIDPATMTVTLELMGETPAKHAYCLGRSGTAPPTPAIGQTGEERDRLAVAAGDRQITIDPITAYKIQASSTGETTTELPEERTVVLRNGGSIVTSDVVFSLESVSAGISATINASTGVLSLTATSAPGDIIVKATYGGNDYFALVTIYRSASYPVAGGGAGSSSFIDSEWMNISSTSNSQVTDLDAIVQSNATGEIRYSAGSTYVGTGAAVLTLQYSLDGVSWSDFETEKTGQYAFPGKLAM